MVKKMLKSKSKRQPAARRYKIEKKVREHSRKLKKEQKVKQKTKSKKKKQVSPPGDCPFRETILQEAEQARKSMADQRLARREQAIEARKEKKEALLAEKRGLTTELKAVKNSKTLNLASPLTKGKLASTANLSFDSLLKKAEDRGYQFERIQQKNTGLAGDVSGDKDNSLKAFYKEFQHVIKESDIIIQILDARDPVGTRSSEAEEAVRALPDKKLMMVLNKCDLVPVENLKGWISYLKQTTGTAVLPFKANTQKQKDRLGSGGSSVSTKHQASLDTRKSIGVSDLMGLLGSWARGAPGGITVGVIGMPNVGKSSIINSLKRSKACSVGAKPGVTRACQFVHLDSKIKLIDSPGVCFNKEKGEASMDVTTIMARVPKNTLMLQYGISDYSSEEEFLQLVAAKSGKLKKGGIVNPVAAEQMILHDWHTGQIRFFTEPPEVETTGTTSSNIVTSLAAPFSLDDFTPKMTLQPSDDEDEDDEDMEGDSDDSDYEDVDMDQDGTTAGKSTDGKGKKKVTFAVDTVERKKKMGAGTDLSPEIKKRVSYIANKKQALKKFRKNKKKSTKKASELSEVIKGLSFD